MNILSAQFECSAPNLDACPDETLPEFAFIGRSNVGKSSLLNMLAGQDGLARVSATPGFTKLINFFVINKTWRLVDLPGYGFAQVAREHMASFNKAVNHYLENRSSLCCVFALIDSSLPPQKIDLDFIAWLASHSIPFVLVFTKTDKANPEKVQANINAFKERISEWFQQLPQILTCSSNTKHGRAALLDVIQETLNSIPDQAPIAPYPSDPTDADTDIDADADDGPARAPKATSRAKVSKATKPRRPNPARPW